MENSQVVYGSGTCPHCGAELGSALVNWNEHKCIKKIPPPHEPPKDRDWRDGSSKPVEPK